MWAGSSDRSEVVAKPLGRLAAAATIFGLVACVAAPTSGLPEEYLGRWYYLGSSGGITGGGSGDAGTGYLVIQSDNTMNHYQDDGTLVATTQFTVARGPTIFSTEDQWILKPESVVPEVIAVSADGRTMTLSENVYDGFSRGYARSR
jgi:hypothetical protein